MSPHRKNNPAEPRIETDDLIRGFLYTLTGLIGLVLGVLLVVYLSN